MISDYSLGSQLIASLPPPLHPRRRCRWAKRGDGSPGTTFIWSQFLCTKVEVWKNSPFKMWAIWMHGMAPNLQGLPAWHLNFQLLLKVQKVLFLSNMWFSRLGQREEERLFTVNLPSQGPWRWEAQECEPGERRRGNQRIHVNRGEDMGRGSGRMGAVVASESSFCLFIFKSVNYKKRRGGSLRVIDWKSWVHKKADKGEVWFLLGVFS